MDEPAKGGVKSKGRKGTVNKGQDYEIHLGALFALNLLEDDTIEDFVFESNVDGHGSLDDLLVKIRKKDAKENYAFQIKHKEEGKVPENCLESKAKSKHNEFSLYKYAEDFNSFPDREIYNYIIYTNACIDKKYFEGVKMFKTIRNGKCPGEKYFFVPSNTSDDRNAGVYNFETTEITAFTESATKETFKSFFKKLAFYNFQKNCEEVKQELIQKFNKIFRGSTESALAYIDIFRYFKCHEFNRMELNKRGLKIKIFELVLSPYVVSPSTQDSPINEFALLNQAFRKFNFVLVDGVDETFFEKIPPHQYFENDEDILYLAKELKLLTKKVKESDFYDKPKIMNKIAYYDKQKPMLVKIHDQNFETIRETLVKLKTAEDNFHFILTGQKLITRTDFQNFTVFETLHDLQQNFQELYHEIVKELKVFVLGKEFKYDELFSDEIAKSVKIKDIFQMLSGEFCLKTDAEILPDPYIPRSLSTNLVKIESLNEISKDLIIITHKEDLKILKILQKFLNKALITVQEYLAKTTKDVVLCQDKLFVEEFEQILKKNPSRNVHHFAVHDEEFLEWVTTKGSIKEVKKCGIFKENYLNENKTFERVQNRINAIVASPGMGKSEIFKKMKYSCPQEVFPIIITLKEHSAFFQKLPEDQKILEYFLKNDNDNDFLIDAKKTFALKRNVIFFVDGLDELPHKYVENALICIKNLGVMGFPVWLSSRPHLEEVIEQRLNIFCMDIKAFSEEDQKSYIRQRLKDQEDVETVMEEIYKNFDIIMDHKDILDIPLQLFMITEILIETKGLARDIFVLSKMFHHFFLQKYLHFFNKNNCTHWEDLEKIVKDSQIYRTGQYQIAALKSCLTREQFDSLNLTFDPKFFQQVQAGDYLGIILKMTPSLVIFHHSVTSSYFAALWFAENFNTCKNLLEEILYKEEHLHLRLLFDMILAEDFPAHLAVLYRNLPTLEENKNEIHKLDRGGRSTLHLACSHGSRYSILENIHGEVMRVDKINTMRKIEEESRKIIQLILEEDVNIYTKDLVFQWNSFDFAIKGSYLPLEMILESKKENSSEIFNLDVVKNNPLTVLHYSSIFSYIQLFRKTFECTTLEPDQIKDLLLNATLFNNWRIILFLLDKNVDIQTSTRSGQTILHLACMLGHVELVTLLIFKEADVNAVDQTGRTPLHLAAANGNLLTVKQLLEKRPNVNSFDKYGRTPLHLATEKGNESVVKYLVEKSKAYVDRRAWNKWGCLELAIIEGYPSLVKFFLDENVSCDRMDEYGTKPLHLAAKGSNLEILDMVLEKSRNVNDLTRDGKTCLHVAAESGNLKMFEHLVSKRGNIDACDNDGKSVLHWAIIAGWIKIVEFLMETEVKVDVTDNNGRNCLQWAAEMGNLGIVELLLTKMKGLVNQQSRNGSSALHWAAGNGYNDIVEVLLKNGANINILDSDGKPPLYWAALEGHHKTVEFLLGKDANNQMIGHNDALYYARSKRKYNSLDYFIS